MRKSSAFVSIVVLAAFVGFMPASAAQKVKKDSAGHVCHLPKFIPPVPQHPGYCRMGQNPVKKGGFKVTTEEVHTLKKDTLYFMEQAGDRWLWCIVPKGNDSVDLDPKDPFELFVHCSNCAVQPGTITIEKDVAGKGTPLDFEPYTINAREVPLDTAIPLAPGTYVVGERQDPDYTATYYGDCPDRRVQLKWGEKKTCEIRNKENQKPPVPNPPLPPKPPSKPPTTRTTITLPPTIGPSFLVGPTLFHIPWGHTYEKSPVINGFGVEGGAFFGEPHSVVAGVFVFKRPESVRKSVTTPACWDTQANALMFWPCQTATFNKTGVSSGHGWGVDLAYRYTFHNNVFVGPAIHHVEWGHSYEHSSLINSYGLATGYQFGNKGVISLEVARMQRPAIPAETQTVQVCWYGDQCKPFTHTWSKEPATNVTAIKLAWDFIF